MRVKVREFYSFTDSFGFLQVREAQLAQYNYILVVGEEEANTGKVPTYTLIMLFFVIYPIDRVVIWKDFAMKISLCNMLVRAYAWAFYMNFVLILD